MRSSEWSSDVCSSDLKSREKDVGLMQNESCDGGGSMFMIHEFVGLRAKCFAYRLYDLENDVYFTACKCKGIMRRKIPDKKAAISSEKEAKKKGVAAKVHELDISVSSNTQKTGNRKDV